MKSRLVPSAHRGTGRMTLMCQFAHYFRLVRGYPVLVIDLAEPACRVISLARGTRVCMTQRQLLSFRSNWLRDTTIPYIGVLAARAVAGTACRDDQAGARCYANLRHLLSQVAQLFDVGLMDSSPWPDARVIYAAALGNALASVVFWVQATLEQVVDFINGSNGVRDARAGLNPALCLIGMVANGVEPTPRQQTELTWLEVSMSAWRVAHDVSPKDSCTCVWLGVDGQGLTMTEFYGWGSTQVAYDPANSAAHFLQRVDRLGRENQ
ncbi:hypothetical protein NUV25_13005 [Burkholderia pseudomultivorans]|uniref:ParA family protein n=1 Tax=Burkholderia pseudomultivorans TaxID=1207504 RepID=UPI002876925B|nr:hypothetical protein [Burkholderia pseudomultivorans]MDS0858625.1 hypothetical protein [Burkholderia pseudomultivorans]